MYFGEYDRIAKIATREGNCIMAAGDGQFGDVEVGFANGLGCLAVARKGRFKRKYLGRAMAYFTKIKDWASKGNPNCMVHNAFLGAEYSALTGNKSMACKEFEEVIRLAGRTGLVNLQALANERLAMLCREMGNDDEAQFRLKEAVRLYDDWGAGAKVALLEKAMSE